MNYRTINILYVANVTGFSVSLLQGKAWVLSKIGEEHILPILHKSLTLPRGRLTKKRQIFCYGGGINLRKNPAHLFIGLLNVINAFQTSSLQGNLGA